MTRNTSKYSQIIWAYIISSVATLVATAKNVEVYNAKAHTYEVLERGSEVRPQFVQPNVSNIGQHTSPTQLGLFVAQPSDLQPLSYGPDPNSGAEARYGRSFGFVPLTTKKRRGTNQDRLSLFTNIDRKKPSGLFDRHRYIDANYKPLASDQFLTPEFVKFKNEIERETDKTHIRGVKMSKDTSYSPTIVYERPGLRKQTKFASPYRRNPITQADESYRKPTYQDPVSYDDGPSSYSSSVYPGTASYSSSSSYVSSPGSSSPSSSSYPPYNSYNSHSSSPYSSTYTNGPPSEPSVYDSDSFPPYPSLPVVDSSSSQYPHSENEARGQGFGSFKDFPSYKRGYKDYRVNNPPSYPINDGKSSYNDDNEHDNDYPPPPAPDSGLFHKAKKYFSKEKYRRPVTNIEEEDDEDGIPEEKPPFRGSHRKGSRIGRPYGKPSHVAVPVSRTENEDEDFDTNYETPENTFVGDENAEDEEEEENEEEPLPAPRESLRQPSHKQHNRLEPAGSRKRCVKKRKEMALEDVEDEPGRHMACLLCENLDTGGTYEKCNYESEPQKKTFFSSNDISYREKSPKSSQKYRKRRDVSIMLETSLNSKRIARKADEAGASYSGDPEDFESDSFDDEETEDDDMAEFKPQPPAYANEDSCVEVKKKNAICMVCENPGAHGKYEQCSYANEPGEDGYEYAQSTQFGSSSHIESPSKSSKKQKSKERQRRKVERKPTQIRSTNPLTNETVLLRETKTNASNVHNVQINQTQVNPQLVKLSDEWHDLRDVEQQKIAAVNKMFHALVRTKKEQPNSRFLADLEDSSYEKQFLNLFPELDTRSASIPRKSILSDLGRPSIFEKDEIGGGFKNKNKIGGFFDSKSILDSGEDGKMSRMMQEFASKDRSACQKRMKDKMTCYLCDDKDGIKREECMYVAEKEPKNVKYQESTHIRGSPDEGRTLKREISKKPILADTDDLPPKYKAPHKLATSVDKKPNRYSNVEIHTKKTYSTEGKPTTTVFKRLATFGDAKDLSKQEQDNQSGSSSKRETFKNKKKKNKEGNDKGQVDEDEISFDPEETGEFKEEDIHLEADPGHAEGAFSDETEVTYDKELKVNLPKFMVEKNEHESVIDDFMSRI